MTKLLTVRELALSWGCHPVTLYRLVESGQIPFVKIGRGRIRFEPEAIAEWIEQKSFSPISPVNPYPQVDLSLANYDRLFLKGGVKLSREGKTWRYPFGSVFSRATKNQGERFYIYYRVEGKRIREAVENAMTRADALKVLQVRVADAFRGKYGFKKQEKRISLSDFGKLYIENYAKVNKRSWKDDLSAIATFKSYFGSSYLNDISPFDLETYKAARIKEGVSMARINRNLTVLKKLFRCAVDWEYLKENPAQKVRRFSENGRRERILEDDERERLLETSAPHLKPILLTALCTAMRRGEILSLKWDQVDLAKRIIHLRKTKSGKQRSIPINSLLFEQLLVLKRANGKSEFVFVYPKTEGPIGNVKTSFMAACKRAKINGLRFHDLRHTAASRMVEAGVDLVTVSKILGHSSIQMTMRYAHPTPENIRRAVETLAKNMASGQDFVPALSPREERVLVNVSIPVN